MSRDNDSLATGNRILYNWGSAQPEKRERLADSAADVDKRGVGGGQALSSSHFATITSDSVLLLMEGNASGKPESGANGRHPQSPASQPQDEWAIEAALVVRAQKNSQAFSELYERYIDRIYSYVYSRVQNVQDAEDLTARIFYRALDRLDRYEDRGLPFGAWLFRIAHNLVANWHRDQSRRTFIPIDGLGFPGRQARPTGGHGRAKGRGGGAVGGDRASAGRAAPTLISQVRRSVDKSGDRRIDAKERGCDQVALLPHTGSAARRFERTARRRRGFPCC